jgi:NAD(P)-dependent dehydrogenase (short-subunit alcohol dehydrogenase family)
MRIDGSSAVVVGGAGGLGEATVRRLCAAGAHVVVADLADERGKALAEELGGRYVRTDATDEDDVRAALAEAESMGPLRISVDTHGGPATGGRLVSRDGEPLDLAGFRRTIDVYLTGVFNIMRLAAAAMARQEPDTDADSEGDGGRGVIVNTASIAAYEGQVGQIPYAAAKGGVVGMTLVAARDLAPLGIRVVTIAPGMFLTPAYGAAMDQVDTAWSPRIPHPKRMGHPAEYAALVHHICENDYLNGEVIRLDAALRFPPK